MTTTDEALIDAMVQAIYAAIPWDGQEPIPLDDMAAKDWMERDAAAVLPIIRKAQADAAREALDGLIQQECDLHSRDQAVYAECGHAAGAAVMYRDAHYPEDVTP